MTLRQAVQHVLVFEGSNVQLPCYCFQEINRILNKRRPRINAALE